MWSCFMCFLFKLLNIFDTKIYLFSKIKFRLILNFFKLYFNLILTLKPTKKNESLFQFVKLEFKPKFISSYELFLHDFVHY